MLDYTYDPQTTTTVTNVAAGAIMVMLAIFLAMLVFVVVCLWRIFTKAGVAGWKSLIPFYNLYVLLRILGRPGWWLLLFFVPIASIIVGVVLALDLAKAFGKSPLFAVLGLLFFPFIGYPMLAFGSATYMGPVAGGGGAQPPVSPAPQPPVSPASTMAPPPTPAA